MQRLGELSFLFSFFQHMPREKSPILTAKEYSQGPGWDTGTWSDWQLCGDWTAMGCRLSVSPTSYSQWYGTWKQQLLSHLRLRLQHSLDKTRCVPLLEQIFKLLLTSHCPGNPTMASFMSINLNFVIGECHSDVSSAGTVFHDQEKEQANTVIAMWGDISNFQLPVLT